MSSESASLSLSGDCPSGDFRKVEIRWSMIDHVFWITSELCNIINSCSTADVVSLFAALLGLLSAWL